MHNLYVGTDEFFRNNTKGHGLQVECALFLYILFKKYVTLLFSLSLSLSHTHTLSLSLKVNFSNVHNKLAYGCI